MQEQRQRRTEYLNTTAREELTVGTGFLAGAQPCAELSASFTESAPAPGLTLHHCQKSAKRTKSSVICREERQSGQLLSTDAGQSLAGSQAEAMIAAHEAERAAQEAVGAFLRSRTDQQPRCWAGLLSPDLPMSFLLSSFVFQGILNWD